MRFSEEVLTNSQIAELVKWHKFLSVYFIISVDGMQRHASFAAGGRRDHGFERGFGFGWWVIKKGFVWMFDGSRVRGIIDEPKPFSIDGMRGSGNLPQVSRSLPFLSLPDSLECGERTRLMNTILLPITGNVHGARLKPYELV
jgi:hypothetical protein